MRNIVIILLLASSSLAAQDYRKLKIGVGMGYGVSASSFSDKYKYSTAVYLEPAYRIDDRICIGLRLENIGWSGLNVTSYTINSQFYLSPRGVRPFLGIGIGYFNSRYNTDLLYGNYSGQEETSLGFYPRIGFDWHHLSISLDANIVTNFSGNVFPPALPAKAQTSTNLDASYFAVKVGLTIGGGKKTR